MKLPCSGLPLSIEVCCLRTWKRSESFLFILNKHTRCRRVYIAALIKTAQQSGNSSGNVAFNTLIFFPGVLSFKALADIAVARGARGTCPPPKFLKNMVILCF